MAVPFGPNPLVSQVNPDPTPLRKRKDYNALAIELGETIRRLMRISGDHQSRYQEEMEACEELSFQAYKLAQYIKKNAWEKPGDSDG